MTNGPAQKPPVKVGIEVDEASFIKLERRADEAVQSIASKAVSANAQIETASNKAGRSLSDAFQLSRKSIDDNVKSLEKVRKELDAVEDKAKKGKGISPESLRKAGGAAGQLGQDEVGFVLSRAGSLKQLQEEIGGILKELGPLGPALVVATGAIIGFQIGTKILDAQLHDVGIQLEKASNQAKIYYQVIASGTTDQLKHQIEVAKQQKRLAEEEINERQKSIDAAKVTGKETGLEQAIKLFAQTRPEFKKLAEDMDQAKQKASQADDTIKALTRGLSSADVKMNDLAGTLQKKVAQGLNFVTKAVERFNEAQLKLAATLRKSGDAEIERVKYEQKINNELLSFTYQQAKDRMKSIEQEKEINDRIILTRGLANSQLDRNSDEYKRNATEMQAATEANKNLNRELKYLTDALDNLPAELEQRNQRLIEVQKKHDTETMAIEERTLQEKASIQEHYNQALINAAKQLVKDTDAALERETRSVKAARLSRDRDLDQQQSDLLYQEEEDRLKAFQDDAKDTREHLREIQQIKKDASVKELSFLINRNFLGLYESRLQTGADIEKSNTKFTDDTKEKQIANEQQITDLKRNNQRARAERLKAYEQQVADAHVAYDQEINDAKLQKRESLRIAEETRTQDLQQLRSKTNQELKLKDSAYRAELKMANSFGTARLKILDQIDAAYLKKANATLSRIENMASGASGGSNRSSAPRSRPMAGGGLAQAFELIKANEGYAGQHEAFQGVPLPKGMGFFIPFQSGSVSQSGGSPSVVVQQTYQISGIKDTQDIINRVLPMAAAQTKQIVKMVIGNK